MKIVENYRGVDIQETDGKQYSFTAKASIWAMPTIKDVKEYIDLTLDKGLCYIVNSSLIYKQVI